LKQHCRKPEKAVMDNGYYSKNNLEKAEKKTFFQPKRDRRGKLRQSVIWWLLKLENKAQIVKKVDFLQKFVNGNINIK